MRKIFRPRLKSVGLQIQMGRSSSTATRTHTHAARPRGQFCVGTPLPHSNSRPPHILLVFVYSFTNLVYSVGKMKPSGNMSYLGEGGQRHFAIVMHCV